MTTDLEALAKRLERTFMRVTMRPTGWGAKTWIARLARLHPMSVSRMLRGTLPADRLVATLDAIDLGEKSADRGEGGTAE